jgi:hypothetical protein
MNIEEDRSSTEGFSGFDRTLLAISSIKNLTYRRTQFGKMIESKTIRITTFGASSFTYHDIDAHQPHGTTSRFPRLTTLPFPSGSMECFALRSPDVIDYMPLMGDPTTRGEEGIGEMADRLEGLVAELQQPRSTATISLI